MDSSSTVSNPLRFAGQFYDPETGTHYNYFRDYDPLRGGYLQSDPIGLKAGVNFYVYLDGSPIIFIDPTGLSKEDVKKIVDAVNRCIKEMTEKGLRSNWKTINNSLPGKLDCWEQTEYVINNCLDNLKNLDDNWAYWFRSGPGHVWGAARSSSPSDPVIWFDARANEVEVGQPCESCKGWLWGMFDVKYGNPEIPPVTPPKKRK